MYANTWLALPQILKESYERKSNIIVLQLPIYKWTYIGNLTLTDVIMDCQVANSNKNKLS